MKKLIVILVISMLLLTSCAAEKPAEPVFTEPTPAPTLTLEPIPTEKPHSEYNEMLRNTGVTYIEKPNVGGFGKPSLSAVEGASKLIVLATVMEKKQHEEWGEFGDCYTFTTAKLKIEKVFKGDLAAGDELVIQELAYVLTNDYGGSHTLASISGRYFPAWEHRSYLFFLEKIEQAEADFIPVDRWHGKYPVSPAAKTAYETGEFTCEALELSNPNGNSPVPNNIVSIFREAYEKYYSDEAVQAIIERESEYQKYYGIEELEEYEPRRNNLCIRMEGREDEIYIEPTVVQSENDGWMGTADVNKRMCEAGINTEHISFKRFRGAFELSVNGTPVLLSGKYTSDGNLTADVAILDENGGYIKEHARVEDLFCKDVQKRGIVVYSAAVMFPDDEEKAEEAPREYYHYFFGIDYRK